MPMVEGVEHHDAKLNPDKVREIRALYRTPHPDDGQRWWTLEEIARRFGVSRIAVWKVINRISWKHVRMTERRRNPITTSVTDSELVRINAFFDAHYPTRSEAMRRLIFDPMELWENGGERPATAPAPEPEPDEPPPLAHPLLEHGSAPAGFYLKFDKRLPHDAMLPYVQQVAQKIIDRDHRLAMDMADLCQVAFTDRGIAEQPGHRDAIALSMRQLGFREELIRAGQPRGEPRRLFWWPL